MAKSSLLTIVILLLVCSRAYSIGNGIDVGLIQKDITYEAALGGPQEIRETAHVPEITIALIKHVPEEIFARLFLEATIQTQNSNYHGPAWDGGRINARPQYRSGHYEANLGYTQPIGAGFSLTPYTGFGYRIWQREIRDPNDTYSQDDEYTLLFFPIGLMVDWRHANFTVGARAVYRFGNAKYTVETINGAGDASFGRSDGYSLEGEVGYLIGDKIGILFLAARSIQNFRESGGYVYFYAWGKAITTMEPAGKETQDSYQVRLRWVW